MYITFEEEKPMDKEEVKPAGASAETEIAEPGFTPGPLTANGNGVHKGTSCVAITFDPERMDVAVAHANARLFAAAPALYEELKASALAVHTIGAYHNLVPFEQCQRKVCIKARAALALVDGPQTKDSDMNNEQGEIEDDRRCGECGSTEGGNCFHCKDGLG